MSKKEEKKFLDSDADGLSDEEEKILGTNPFDHDTDSDGLGDYQEAKIYETDPNNPDTSGDGIPDGLAVKMGINPKGPGFLSDLFIPSPSNQYRPKSLQPKRLFFHAFSAVIIKLVMVAFLMSFPVQAWFSPDILYEQAQKIISLTNNIRIQSNLDVLEENEVLSQAALDKAQDMLINQYFAHVGPDNKSLRHWLFSHNYAFRVAGENLAIGFDDPQKVVDAWVKSPTHYANIIDPEYSQIGVGVVSGEYKGFPTVLIAQYFSQPAQVVVAVEEPQKPAEVKKEDYNTKIDLASSEEPVLPLQETTDEVLGQTEEEETIFEENQPEEEPSLPVFIEPVPEKTEEDIVLTAPTLIYPENNSFFKESSINIQILAPQAEKVLLISGSETIKEISNASAEGIFEAQLELTEGEHRLRIQSIAGSQAVFSTIYNISVDNTPPVIDHQKTIVLVNQPSEKDDLLVNISAYLSSDTTEAIFNFDQYQIKLDRDFSEEGKWAGSIIVSDKKYEEVFNPIVMPSLTVSDQMGNVLTQDLAWENILPVENSLIDEYVFLSVNKPEFIKPLFDVSSIYFKFIMILAILALTLNIFIHIRKQHYPTIVSSIGFILLMGLLTIF